MQTTEPNNTQPIKDEETNKTEQSQPSEYELYCRQQEELSEMLDDDGRCFPEMAEGQFVRGH